jgi:hypothetical protein
VRAAVRRDSGSPGPRGQWQALEPQVEELEHGGVLEAMSVVEHDQTVPGLGGRARVDEFVGGQEVLAAREPSGGHERFGWWPAFRRWRTCFCSPRVSRSV